MRMPKYFTNKLNGCTKIEMKYFKDIDVSKKVILEFDANDLDLNGENDIVENNVDVNSIGRNTNDGNLGVEKVNASTYNVHDEANDEYKEYKEDEEEEKMIRKRNMMIIFLLIRKGLNL